MKTYLTYLIAAALGLLAQRFFGSYAVFNSLITSVCSTTVSILSLASVAFAGITLAAGVASALRPGREKGTFRPMYFFSLLILLLCAASGVAAASFFPVSATVNLESASGAFVLLENPLSVYAVLICVICAAVVVGINFRPTANIYVSAYNALNSLSEVCYRLMCAVSRFFFILICFFASCFVSNLTGTLDTLASVLALGAFLALVLIPLVFAVFTSFKVNPYRILLCFLPAMISGFFSASYTVSFPSLYTDARFNAGIQKRISSVSIAFSYFAGRAGTAAFTAFIVLSVLPSASISVKAVLILVSVFSSLFAPFGEGVGIVYTCAIALRLFGYSDSSSLMGICTLLPVLNALCIMTDIEVSGFTAAFTAEKKGAMCKICTNDMV